MSEKTYRFTTVCKSLIQSQPYNSCDLDTTSSSLNENFFITTIFVSYQLADVINFTLRVLLIHLRIYQILLSFLMFFPSWFGFLKSILADKHVTIRFPNYYFFAKFGILL